MGGGDRDANNRNASTRSSYGDGNTSSSVGSDRGSARGSARGGRRGRGSSGPKLGEAEATLEMIRSLNQRPITESNDFKKIPVGGRLSRFAHKWTQRGSAN